MTLRTKSVYSASFFPFFWILATRYSQGPLIDFDAKYAKTRGSAQGCAFSGSRSYNLTFRPPFPQISATFGTIFDGTENFRLKSLNNGDAHLRTPLNRHRRRIKVA